MKSLIACSAVLFASAATFANAPTNVVHISKAKMAAIIAKNGGMVKKPGTGLGCILFANEQRLVPVSELIRPVAYLAKYTKLNVSIKDCESVMETTPKAAMSKFGANMLIQIKDDAAVSSPLIVSPDEAWATVNVAALAKDSPTTEVLAFRLRKEMSRAFAFLCGGVNTQYERTPVNYCASLKDLDYIDMDEVPADLIARFRTYTPGYGVTPSITATYKTACRHGWAPPPTNDVQKAIWNKVHAMPTEPLKIKPETKKQEK